jgi:hypothetical protein
MKHPKRPPQQSPDLPQAPSSQLREIVMTLTMDDLQHRLNQLAREGRQQDCLALMKELGDWQSYGRGNVAPILHAPYNGNA